MKKALTITIIALLAILVTNCKETPQRDKNHNKTHKELKVNKYGFDNPPEFHKDGELKFISENDSVIFNIDTELATNKEEHARGLMFRKQMDENKGMLFIFNDEDMRFFWMQNTLIPLDIIYINAKKEVVSIAANAKPLDITTLPSEAPAMYVVEINAGLCEKYGIVPGTKISF